MTRKIPKEFSAYVVVASDIEGMPVESVLIDKGAAIVRDWNVINFETGETTGAVGNRLTRVCVDCKIRHNRVGVLGHDGECGSEPVIEEARQVIADAKKRLLAEAAA